MEIYNKVLEMLGVEEGEEFCCLINNLNVKSRYKYKFKEGKLFQIGDAGYCEMFKEGFIKLINGEWKIYRKTYKDDFLEKFPNAPLNEKKCFKACWSEIYGDGCCYKKPSDYSCYECWNKPMIDR